MKASLNHYHISCRDKFELAWWYQEKLGFELIVDLEALGEKDGPVIVSADGGQTGISIFTAKKDLDRDFSIKTIPAFEVSPEDFLDFYKSHKKEVADVVIYDHRVSFSIYLFDPVGSKIEIVCNQYQKLEPLLKKDGIFPKRMNPVHDPAYGTKPK